MDTRTKIISAAESARLAASGALVVSGLFDPLTASHAARLQSLKRDSTSLLVVISAHENEILSAGARAHLIAGLACVNYVVIASDETPKPSITLEREDAVRLEQLIDHVHARQQA